MGSQSVVIGSPGGTPPGMDTRPIPGEPYSSLRSFIDAGGNPTELDCWETLGSDLVIDVGEKRTRRLAGTTSECSHASNATASKP